MANEMSATPTAPTTHSLRGNGDVTDEDVTFLNNNHNQTYYTPQQQQQQRGIKLKPTLPKAKLQQFLQHDPRGVRRPGQSPPSQPPPSYGRDYSDSYDDDDEYFHPTPEQAVHYKQYQNQIEFLVQQHQKNSVIPSSTSQQQLEQQKQQPAPVTPNEPVKESPIPRPIYFDHETSHFNNRTPLHIYSDDVYASAPRNAQEIFSAEREKYVATLDTKYEVVSFIESELDREEPLLLPVEYTPEEVEVLESNYQQTIEEIAHCTTTFCPDQKLLYDRAIRISMELDSPEHIYYYRKCRFDRILALKDPEDCQSAIYPIIEQLMPRVLKSIEKTTMLQTGERLENYIGFNYNAPFWFYGAGDIWRRSLHNSSLLRKEMDKHGDACHSLHEALNQCVEDGTKTDDDCYYLYTQSKSCNAGLNCRYLRLPLLNCLNANQFTNYEGVTACVEMLPNYATCQDHYTPPPASISVDIHDILDQQDLPSFKKNMTELTTDIRREKYDEMLLAFENRAKELIKIYKDPDDLTPEETQAKVQRANSFFNFNLFFSPEAHFEQEQRQPTEDYSDAELIFLFKHKHLPLAESKKRLAELSIANEPVNPYDELFFSDEIALQPVLHSLEDQKKIYDEQIALFKKFHEDLAETKEGITNRVDAHLSLLSQIREQVKKRFHPENHEEYPDIKNVMYFDNYWGMYFAYQPILNTSYPVFPLNHLYHYQDFEYDWVDPKGTITSVPFLRIDRVGQNFSPSLFTKEIIKHYPRQRLMTCMDDLDCDKQNKQSGAYLGFPQLDDMAYLNHYRMYFKDRDMYFTCWANDTTCVPSRFPDDNYGTFRDSGHFSRSWFFRPDRFEYYSYDPVSGDRLVYSIGDKKVFTYTKGGLVSIVPEESDLHQQVQQVFRTQTKIWEREAVNIMLERQKKENILKAHVQQGGSLLSRDVQNTQFDDRIPFTVHPFASYADNLNAYRYYLKIKEREQTHQIDLLANDPSLDSRERIKYKFRKHFQFYDPITTLHDDDANKIRDALILSYHELKLSRHPLGSVIMTEMPPRVGDRLDLASKMQQDALYNYLSLLRHDSNAAVMFDTNPDSPQVKLYMTKHNLTSFEQYAALVAFAQEFQKELVDEFQMLELNEMKHYQEFLAKKATEAANLKLTYTEKLTRLFKLHEKYGKVAPNLHTFNAQFGFHPDGIHHHNEARKDTPRLIDPEDLFTFGV